MGESSVRKQLPVILKYNSTGIVLARSTLIICIILQLIGCLLTVHTVKVDSFIYVEIPRQNGGHQKTQGENLY